MSHQAYIEMTITVGCLDCDWWRDAPSETKADELAAEHEEQHD